MNLPLACANVSVRYGNLQALDNVSVEFEAGKIHVLLGQNGAGKTTLARFMSGLIANGQGDLTVMGNPVSPGDVSQIRKFGLDIVHQRFTLPPEFTVADALELTAAHKMGGMIFSKKAVARSWCDEMRKHGIDVSPRARIGSLPIETVQSLEILRALAGNVHILILDEPTALLSPGAIGKLFDRLRKLKSSGVTLIVILHKLQEVFEIADTITILRDGKLVAGVLPVTEATSSRLSDHMIGSKPVDNSDDGNVNVESTKRKHLSIHSVTTFSKKANEPELDDVTLEVCRSEIVGIAGIEGNGQRQLADVICGFAKLKNGTVTMGGKDLAGMDPVKRRKAGIRAVPFDRITEGASLDTNLWENTSTWRAEEFRVSNLPIISIRTMKLETKELLSRMDVRYNNLEQKAGMLSGGNLQRLILARELVGNVTLLVAAQPTRGLDFNATDFVLNSLVKLRNDGTSILLISSDLDELFEICDRIDVLHAGSITGRFQRPYDRKSIGDAMVGAQ